MDIFKRHHIDVVKSAKRAIVIRQYMPKKGWKQLVRLFAHICCSKYRFEASYQGTSIVFLNGISSKRKTEEVAYEKIRACAGEYDEIRVIQKMGLANIPCNLSMVIKYAFLLMKQKKPAAESLIILQTMLQIRSFLLFLEKQPLQRYTAGIVYNDLDQFDNAFVQYLQNIGVKTATCQHGMFSAPRPNSGLYFSGVELQHSIADIFLAWNPMTYDEATLAGMAPSKIKILGIPKCIGNMRDTQHEHRNRFGVILNLAGFHDYNIKLLQAANYIANKNDMKYYIKFHPSLDISAYDDYLDEQYAIKLPIKTSVTEYADLVDFSILSHSSVYVELLFLKNKVYLLHVDNLCKFTHFPEYDFSSKEELDELIHKDYDVDKMFNYYCFTDDPQQEYTRFFKELKDNRTDKVQ